MKKQLWFSFLIFCMVSAVQVSLAAEPPTRIKLSIPDYVVYKVGEFDEVLIPDGQILTIEEGRPQVPYYMKKVELPRGYRVQEVVMEERSGVKTDSGLKLPPVSFDTIPVEESKIKKGLYPLKDFDWKAWRNERGPETLAIFIYPFYYNPKTTQVQFYKDYLFTFRYIQTTIEIISVSVNKPVYEPKENVKIQVQLTNLGKPEDITVKAKIRKLGIDEKVDSLSPRFFKKLSGSDSLTLEWRTARFQPIDYYCEVVLADNRLNLLDRKTVSFSLGSELGEIIEFKTAPQHFKIGDKINLFLKFKNTGTREISGDGIFIIQEKGNIIKQLSHKFTKLSPGNSLSFKDDWDTKEANKGTLYNIIGYVRYNGTATEAKKVIASTNLLPVAKFTYSPEKPSVDQDVEFDGAISGDADGKIVAFDWDFGDGGNVAGEKVSHSYSLHGDYPVTLTVTDNEGATGQITLVISVEKE